MIVSILYILTWMLATEIVKGQVCRTDAIVGLNPLTNGDTSNYGKGINAVLLNNVKYRFSCCGFVNQWQIRIRSGVTEGTIVKGQIWVDESPWKLVGENDLVINGTDSVQVIDIPVGSRIKIRKDAFIGFRETTESVIMSSAGLNASVTFLSSSPNSFDWNSESTLNQEYSISARVHPSDRPVIGNIGDVYVITKTIAAGTVLVTLAVDDRDPEDEATHTFGIRGSDAYFVDFNAATSDLSIKYGVTIEPGAYFVGLVVSDGCAANGGLLQIVVENDLPVITSLLLNNTILISEDLSTETLLHLLVVEDSDPFICMLDNTDIPFEVKNISSTEYGIFLTEGAYLDFDTQNTYILTVRVNDTYDSITGNFTVHLFQNQPPAIVGLPWATDVHEDTTAETSLYTFQVTDQENDLVSCRILETSPNLPTIFLRNSSTSKAFDIVLGANPVLQYDLVKTYRVDINCADHRRAVNGTFFVNVVRNQSPVFTNLPNVTSFSALTSGPDQTIFSVAAFDPDNDAIQYSMACSSCPFVINQAGNILLTRPVHGETVPAYDLIITIDDGVTPTISKFLTIYVSEINSVPSFMNLPLPADLELYENTPVGNSVYQVLASDMDNADSLTFSIISTPGNANSYFGIDTTSGLVSIAAPLDYEALSPEAVFLLTITVTDGKDTYSQNITVNVLDVNEPPVFTTKDYFITVDEGPVGTVLPDPSFLFTDQDTADVHTFSLVCQSDKAFFHIDPQSGVISLSMDIDYDDVTVHSSYACVVMVSDGLLTDTASLTVTLNNVNDNAPVIFKDISTVYVDADIPVFSTILTMNVTDHDKDPFDDFTLDVQEAYGRNYFGIYSNGDLYIRNGLSGIINGRTLVLTVTATDVGGLQGTAKVFVNVASSVTTTVIIPYEDRYMTFWESPKNVAWIVIVSVFGLIILVTLPFVLFCRQKVADNQSRQQNEEINRYETRKRFSSGSLPKPAGDVVWEPYTVSQKREMREWMRYQQYNQ